MEIMKYIILQTCLLLWIVHSSVAFCHYRTSSNYKLLSKNDILHQHQNEDMQLHHRKTKSVSYIQPSSSSHTVLSCPSRITAWNIIENDEKRTEIARYDVSGHIRAVLKFIITRYFLPTGELSADYYVYARWRMMQRFISSTSAVFGTQSLLLALGFSRSSSGIAASIWILKDALGKFTRIIWASKYGRKFDAEAKHWRFLSSVLFSLGNGLEILTYMLPSFFLLIAAVANALKQMAMVTYSSTRNTIYKSFSRGSDNIGDITAKGEAQTAVIDLLGMLFGVLLSKAIGTAKFNIIIIFVILTVCDLWCIYHEIKSVVFNTLNFERTSIVLDQLYDDIGTINHPTPLISSPSNMKPSSSSSSSSLLDKLHALNPFHTSTREKFYLPTKYSEGLFQTIMTSSIPSSLSQSIYQPLFIDKHHEHFIVQLHASSIKHDGRWHEKLLYHIGGLSLIRSIFRGNSKYVARSSIIRNHGMIDDDDVIIRVKAEILLHKNASNIDVFRALVILHRSLWMIRSISSSPILSPSSPSPSPSSSSSSSNAINAVDLINHEILPSYMMMACEFEKEWIESIYTLLSQAGWVVSKFMYGAIRERSVW